MIKKQKELDNDDTRDIAIRCVNSMFEHNLLDSKYYEQNDEFIIQDIIHNEINKELNIKEDDAKQNQYDIRELVIINFIEWYASEEEDREPLRKAMQLYLQQELWVDFEGMELKDIREEKE